MARWSLMRRCSSGSPSLSRYNIQSCRASWQFIAVALLASGRGRLVLGVKVEDVEGHEAEHPRLEVGAFGVGVEFRERGRHSTLDDVLHLGAVTEHPPAIDLQRLLQRPQKFDEGVGPGVGLA